MNSPLENEPIRKYLNRVTTQLLFTLPREERLKVRHEIQMHLDAMIQQETAQGKTPKVATEVALRRFGDPRKIGRTIRKTWLQQHPRRSTKIAPRNRIQLIIRTVIYFLFVNVFVTHFPSFSHDDQQPNLLAAIIHGFIYGLVFFSSIALFSIGFSPKREDQTLPPEILEMGDTYEQRAETFAAELGTAMTPEKKDKVRRIQKRIRLFLKVIPLFFYLFMGLTLWFILASPTVSMQSRLVWCYNLSEFSTFPMPVYLVSKIQAKNRREPD